MTDFYKKQDEGYDRANFQFRIIKRSKLPPRKVYEKIKNLRSPYTPGTKEAIGYAQARRHSLESMCMVYPFLRRP